MCIQLCGKRKRITPSLCVCERVAGMRGAIVTMCFTFPWEETEKYISSIKHAICCECIKCIRIQSSASHPYIYISCVRCNAVCPTGNSHFGSCRIHARIIVMYDSRTRAHKCNWMEMYEATTTTTHDSLLVGMLHCIFYSTTQYSCIFFFSFFLCCFIYNEVLMLVGSSSTYGCILSFSIFGFALAANAPDAQAHTTAANTYSTP